MKTKTIITELTQEDLVDLFCTATYDSCYLEVWAPQEEREGIDIEEGDCREDVWAKVLLGGHKITCCDHNAEGEVYSQLGRVDEDEDGIYVIGLEDVIRGLQSAIDSTFKGDDAEHRWARECVEHFMAGEGEMDLPEADALVQIILFDEIIYG